MDDLKSSSVLLNLFHNNGQILSFLPLTLSRLKRDKAVRYEAVNLWYYIGVDVSRWFPEVATGIEVGCDCEESELLTD